MKILVIDSHKSGDDSEQQNLHWINGKIISKHLNAKYIWSYPTVNDNIDGGYDAIIFNHASNYSFESEEWIKKSPNAKLFYVCNDYNLGEAITLWKHCKENDLRFNVIANHHKTCTKIVKKWVNDWHFVNLNCLVFDPYEPEESIFGDDEKRNCIYYGTFRKDRRNDFKKYLQERVILSTHETNFAEFRSLGCKSPKTGRIIWHPKGRGLWDYKYSLCIEDETTYTNYSHLPNRFYEALNYGVIPMFDVRSKENINLSGYKIPHHCFVTDHFDLIKKMMILDKLDMSTYMYNWRRSAEYEKQQALDKIKTIIEGD